MPTDWTTIAERAQADRDPAPVIAPARYAKGQMAAHCPGVDGYKSRAQRLACHLNGRYSGREKAFIMSPKKAAELVALFEAGRDAWSMGGLRPVETD